MLNNELKRSKRERFTVIYDWMRDLGLPLEMVLTYACVWSLTRAGMRPTAKYVARQVRRTERTVRRHFEVIRSLGLWEPRHRYDQLADGGYRQKGNQYVFLPHEAMPAACRRVLTTELSDGVSLGLRDGLRDDAQRGEAIVDIHGRNVLPT